MISQGNSMEMSKSRTSYLYKSIEEEGNLPNPSILLQEECNIKKTGFKNLFPQIYRQISLVTTDTIVQNTWYHSVLAHYDNTSEPSRIYARNAT